MPEIEYKTKVPGSSPWHFFHDFTIYLMFVMHVLSQMQTL